MINYYFKTAWTFIKSKKLSSFVNVTGLVLGMSSSIIILLWIFNEVSYDRFHAKTDQIYEVYKEQVSDRWSNKYSEGTAPALVENMAADFPEIEKYTRYKVFSKRSRNSNLIRYKDVVFSEELFGFADTNFFNIFSFSFIQGNPENALRDLNSIVLTETISKKIFGDEDPMGKTVRVDSNFSFKVSAIIKDVPKNSTLQFKTIINFTRMPDFMPEYKDYVMDWGIHFFKSYVLLQSGTDVENFSQKIHGFLKTKMPNVGDDWAYFVKLLPLKKLHLNSIFPEGNKKNVVMFSIIAGLLLLVSCINFMTLTTARSTQRAKEVGIKKTFGASRKNLIIQFYIETFLLTIISLLISLTIVKLVLPFCNELLGSTLSFYNFGSSAIVGILILIVLCTSLIAGSYPAILLSSFRPIKVLYGVSSNTQGGNLFRKILVIIQFIFSVTLIIGTVVIFKQYAYMQNKDLGFNYHNTIYVNISGKYLEKYDYIKSELLKSPDINNVTASTAIMTRGAYTYTNFGYIAENGEPINKGPNFGFNNVDNNFLTTFGMDIIDGENFDPTVKNPDDEVIINEAALKILQIENPIGQKVMISGGASENSHIIGIAKDFHFLSLRSDIKPLVLSFDPSYFRFIYAKINPLNSADALKHIEKTFLKADPNIPFEFQYLDIDFDNLYRTEALMANLFGVFSIILVLITCLGLFALSAFTAEQKIKEVGIRKTYGASMKDIILLMIKSIIYLTVIANIIAWPIAYLVFDKWLNNFSYRIDLSVWIFIFSFLISMIISMGIVLYQSIKAGRSNPLDSLRYE